MEAGDSGLACSARAGSAGVLLWEFLVGACLCSLRLTDPEVSRRHASLAVTATQLLLEGEAGTGKELVAEELHLASRRKDGPFAALDASALPKQELEGRLFGTDSEPKGLVEQRRAACSSST